MTVAELVRALSEIANPEETPVYVDIFRDSTAMSPDSLELEGEVADVEMDKGGQAWLAVNEVY